MAKWSIRSMVGRPLLILGGVLLSASLVHAGPVSLGDGVLDHVTAGGNEVSGSGGAIVGNSSEATINQTGGVTLEGEAQSGAKGLNLVNSAESTVANGVNVWDIQNPRRHDGQATVEQSNIIDQEQRRSASMPNYSRPDADTYLQVVHTGSETHNNSLNRNNTVVDVQSITADTSSTSTASVDTTIKGGGSVGGPTDPQASIDTNVGKGGAGAGVLDLLIDGGEAQIGLAVGGSVLAAPDIVTPTANRPNESYGGMVVGDANSDFSLYGRLILPEVEIQLNGAGCGVAMGSCDAGGTAREVTSNTMDNSVMDTEVATSVGNSEYVDNLTETYRSPFELSNAQAEYIVVDDSSLAVNTTFNLTLSGSAQSNANGMNVVNATGSAVADGVNVARTGNLDHSGELGLTQSNIISHSR